MFQLDRRPTGTSEVPPKSPERSRTADPGHLEPNQAATSPFSSPDYHYDDGGASEPVREEEWDHELIGGCGPPSNDDEEEIDVVRTDEHDSASEVPACEAIDTQIAGHTDVETRSDSSKEGKHACFVQTFMSAARA